MQQKREFDEFDAEIKANVEKAAREREELRRKELENSSETDK
jgi:hypothetical protein